MVRRISNGEKVIQRDELIDWILRMKDGDENHTPQPDFARQALIDYDTLLPWLELMQGVRDKLGEHDGKRTS